MNRYFRGNLSSVFSQSAREEDRLGERFRAGEVAWDWKGERQGEQNLTSLISCQWQSHAECVGEIVEQKWNALKGRGRAAGTHAHTHTHTHT